MSTSAFPLLQPEEASPTPNGTGQESKLSMPIPTIQEPLTAADIKGERDAEVVDAGLKSLDHYKRALPRWRYRLRQRLLPLVRWETPYLAYFQSAVRTPALDSYFAITANLGTHTFFMIGLPMLFWFGHTHFGKGLVQILASGVFFSGFLKDMCSLPRPLSPPLHRITMSDMVALEYGFPSTHSTNAVSVAVYGLLAAGESDFAPATRLFFECLAYFYAFSIVVGRLYCGMHGFVDVIFGSLLGAAISLVQFYHGPELDAYMQASSWVAPLTAAIVILVLVRIHPEPADDCPCFDDSVAFAGVMIGLQIGSWRLPRSQQALGIQPGHLNAPSLPVALMRIVLGVLVVFAWREVMKPTLLKTLPHLFRIIEQYDLNMPRRFFMHASEYRSIPEVLRLRTDNVIPSVSDFPNIMRNIRNARRGRSISIGPQSAADAYETLAYRERRRRESIGSQGSVRSRSSFFDLREQAMAAVSATGTSNGVAIDGNGNSNGNVKMGDAHVASTANAAIAANAANDRDGKVATASGVQKNTLNALAQFEEMMGQGTVYEASGTPRLGSGDLDTGEPELFIGRQDELGEREIFEKLVKPRVRYDVEVVTKLIVYTGIAWLAVEVMPVLFELVGLGSHHT